MYYLVFGIFYLISLLPFWVLYGVSNFCCFVLYRLLGYRKKVVLENLRYAFPEKSETEIAEIARLFYRNFCDTWLEMLKLLSVSRKALEKRIQVDASLLYEIHKTGKSVQGFGGHFMNWEYTNISIPQSQPFPFLGVYAPVGNAIFDRMLIHLRSRFGTILLRAGRVKRDMLPWEDKQYLMGLGADQNPSNPNISYWLYFMNRPVAFVSKPWKKTKELDQPAVYMEINRLKRGHFHFRFVPLCLDPSTMTEEEMALRYRDLLENDIRNNPDNYLWTHKRWKRTYTKEYEVRWIDTSKPPVTD